VFSCCDSLFSFQLSCDSNFHQKNRQVICSFQVPKHHFMYILFSQLNFQNYMMHFKDKLGFVLYLDYMCQLLVFGCYSVLFLYLLSNYLNPLQSYHLLCCSYQVPNYCNWSIHFDQLNFKNYMMHFMDKLGSVLFLDYMCQLLALSCCSALFLYLLSRDSNLHQSYNLLCYSCLVPNRCHL